MLTFRNWHFKSLWICWNRHINYGKHGYSYHSNYERFFRLHFIWVFVLIPKYSNQMWLFLFVFVDRKHSVNHGLHYYYSIAATQKAANNPFEARLVCSVCNSLGAQTLQAAFVFLKYWAINLTCHLILNAHLLQFLQQVYTDLPPKFLWLITHSVF